MNAELDFSDWIGKSETEHGFASAYPADYFTGTLDRADGRFADGDPLPPAWHYFYFHELVALAETGPDGHRAKGHFMPALPFPEEGYHANCEPRFCLAELCHLRLTHTRARLSCIGCPATIR